ncbi:MAG TPA: energy transducer TonB [Bryobacteraceae bacterium]|nr:energy transducer TonB [Bryobacteraceae bacterium]
MFRLIASCLLALSIAVPALAGEQEKVYKVGDGVSAPQPIEKHNPEYTKEAKDAKIEGTVVLKVEITSEGRVENVKVEKSLRPDLDEQAIKAAETWKFKPAMKDGKPVRVQATIEINFRLS